MKRDRKHGTAPTVFDYKDLETLQRFLTPQGRLYSTKRSGLTARQQRSLKKAVKYARFLSLLSYTPL